MSKKLTVLLLAVGTLLHPARAFQAEGNFQKSSAEESPREQHPDLRLEHAEVPMYPLLVRTARVFGTVEVQVAVNDGEVVSTKVLSGPPLLAPPTVENIQTWHFNSAVNATFTTKFIYQLKRDEALDSPNGKVELQLPLLVKITAVPITID